MRFARSEHSTVEAIKLQGSQNAHGISSVKKVWLLVSVALVTGLWIATLGAVVRFWLAN